MKRLLAFCVFLIVSSKCFSQDWIFVAAQKSTDSVFMRSNYVSKSHDEGREDVIKIWIKIIHQSAVVNKKTYKNLELRTLWYVDCSAKQIKTGSTVLYSRSGDLLQNSENLGAFYNDVIPDTMGEQILEKVCTTFNK